MTHRTLALIVLLVLPVSMAMSQTQSKPPESALKGYVAPPPIPGYEPNNDPKDFTGVWRNVPLPGAPRFALAPGIKLNEKAAAQNAATLARMKASKATSIATPHVMCRPTGANQAMFPIAPVYVLQNGKKMVFVVTDEIRNVRTVYLNAKHPKKLRPTYGGHSVAHWEGNTLVIDTVGYNGRGQLIVGSLHSDRFHLVERISKSADGRALEIDAMFEDPETMAEPVRVKKRWEWISGQQPLEFDCEENPREDNFADMLFEQEYLKPRCIQHEGKGDALSKVVCEKP
jgi:hypothetical protein